MATDAATALDVLGLMRLESGATWADTAVDYQRENAAAILARAPLYMAIPLVHALHVRSLLTVYTRFGDWFVGLCAILFFAAWMQRPAQQEPAGLIGLDIGPSQHPRAGGRREGRGRQELWIVGAPCPLIGVGPGVVEDVFPLAVGLHVERHDRGHPALSVLDR